jgi:ElaB/YqjD/DUF883 family membrane-anchored ribosome-binding protein
MTGTVPVDESDDDVYTTEYIEIERTAVPPHTGSEDIETARARIEETRAEMSETIDAIKEKLSPDHLVQQAKEATVGRAQEAMHSAVDTAREAMYSAGDTAKGASMTMMETIRQNPMPAAMAGIGLGWLYMNARSQTARRQRYEDTLSGYRYTPGHAEPRPVTYPVDRPVSPSHGRMAEAADQARDKAGQLTDQAKEKMGEMAHQVQDRASHLSEQAHYQTDRVVEGFQRTLHQNPLAMGAVAMALGAALGLAVPETEQENRWMGEARDHLMEKAQATAHEVADKVQNVAQEAVQTAKEEARHQGLTPQGQQSPNFSEPV